MAVASTIVPRLPHKESGGRNAVCGEEHPLRRATFELGALRLVNPVTHNDVATTPDELDRHWAQLMAAAQDGDKTAYAELLHDIVPVLRVAIRYRYRGWGETEDILQDVLLSLHRVRHTYDPSRSFRAWLLAIAHRRSVDALRIQSRKTKRETLVDQEILEQVAAADTQEPAGTRYEPALAAAIAELPAAQRQAIELVKLHELTFAEASAQSGISVAALKVSVHRALKKLRANLVKA